MKGASDGGLHVPHKEKRFPGFHIIKAEIVQNKRGKAIETEKAKSTFDPKEHRSHIFGGHVQAYYDMLKGENAQRFNKQFSQWEKALKGGKFEDLYKKVHAAIRADPSRAKPADKKVGRKVVSAHVGYKIFTDGNKKKKSWIRHFKLTRTQREERIEKKKQDILVSVM